MAAISQRVVEALEAGETDRFVWDDKLDGFGVRVYPSGRKKYLIQWKREGRTRRLVLGSHPLMKAERARRLAIDTLAAVERGEDPAAERDHARASPTIAQLCASWLALGTGPTGKPKRASSLAMDRSRIEAHVVPVLGALKVRSVHAAHIRALVEKIATGATAVDERIEGRPRARRIVKGGPGVAHRTLRMLHAVLAYAVREGLIASNPAHHVHAGDEEPRQRYLAPAELRRLGAALDAAEVAGIAWQALAAIRFILATGLRRNEALALRWPEVDLDGRRLVLAETKTGRSIRPLSRAAIAILAGVRARSSDGWVFPASRGTGHYLGLQRVWVRIRADAELADVHLHDLRHSFAAFAAMSGASLLTVGRMLGHSKARSSERYAHLADGYLSDAADRVADVLDLDMARAETRKSGGAA